MNEPKKAYEFGRALAALRKQKRGEYSWEWLNHLDPDDPRDEDALEEYRDLMGPLP